MITLQGLELRRGSRVLLRDADLLINAGQKVGLTGANGVGKSSLFALLLGQLSADAGLAVVAQGAVIAHVAQELPRTSCPAIEYVLDGDQRLRGLEAQLAAAQAAADGMREAELHASFEQAGGYAARSKAATLMFGLGFRGDQIDQPATAFSGGWQMRLNLAKALMCPSDLLLLDEPTNHLDLDAVIWLRDWLVSYTGTLILISHDRDFLDEITDHIAHVEQQGLSLYKGNYSAFEVRRAERLAQQQSAYERQQRTIEHMQAFVSRFGAKASKATQAQSRVKALEKLAIIAPAHVDSPFTFSFPPANRVSNPLLRLEQAALGYSKNVPVLRNIDITLNAGDRVGLLGPNGQGKSTLIKALAGGLTPLQGEVHTAQKLRIGYFAQHQLDQLDPEASPLMHLQRLDGKALERDLRNFLGGFDFCGDQALGKVGPFSGGEKARLALALIVYQNPNVLLLDEPTNHLDLEMRHALTLALQDFEGALVVVSHDRHLLRSVTDVFWIVVDGVVMPFAGDLDDYRLWLQARGRQTSSDSDDAASALSRKEQRQQNAQRREQLKPLMAVLRKAEQRLEQLNERRQVISSELNDPDLYEAPHRDRLQSLLKEQGEIDKEIASTEATWLETSAALESATVP